jgi:hypothetical protein
VAVPCGDVVVAVLSTETPADAAGIRVTDLHLLDPLGPAAPASFDLDLFYNIAFKVSLSLIVTLFSLNCSMYVCVEMRFDFV